MDIGRDPVRGWIWLDTPFIRDGGGPSRVVTDEPDPTFKPRPVGFTARIEPLEVDPLLWEGDGA